MKVEYFEGMERFEHWQSPTIEEGKLMQWNWMVQYAKNLQISPRVDIGAFPYINAKFGVVLEEGVQLGSHCSIYSESTIDQTKGRVVLKKNCCIGSHCTIMPNITIGENTIVGAHSFVNRSLPDHCVAVGCPVKIIRYKHAQTDAAMGKAVTTNLDVCEPNCKSNKKIIFCGKKDDVFSEQAIHFCKMNFYDVKVFVSAWKDPFPEKIYEDSCDYLINFLSRWIIPEAVLKKVKIAAINFHPGSPNYPGIGCNNFALYENASSYGVTCHHMLPAVDTGGIIATKTFPVYPTDNVDSLLERTYPALLMLFYEIMDGIRNEKPLPVSEEKWMRKAFTRKEFNELMTIREGISEDELKRKIRATSYKQWNPSIDLHGYKFQFCPHA